MQTRSRSVRSTTDGRYKHGFSPRGKKTHRLYSTWAGMIQRCKNPKNISFKWYGAKGIRVCDRWKIFKNFMEDMLPNWKPHLTLERKDNSKDYCPRNCRWATTHEQRMNDNHGKVLELNGRRQRLTAWAKEIGISDVGLRQRLRLGWSVERALTTPARATKP